MVDIKLSPKGPVF